MTANITEQQRSRLNLFLLVNKVVQLNLIGMDLVDEQTVADTGDELGEYISALQNAVDLDSLWRLHRNEGERPLTFEMLIKMLN